MDQKENHLHLNQAKLEITRAKFEIKVWGLNLPLIFLFKAATISCQISESIASWSVWGSSRIWQTIVDSTLLNLENKQLVGKMSKETNPPLSGNTMLWHAPFLALQIVGEELVQQLR